MLFNPPRLSVGLALVVIATALRAAESAPAPTPASAPLIPLEHFFAEADYSSAEVSPDGKYVAFLTTLGTGKVGIALMDLATGKSEALVGGKDENVEWFFWKNGSEFIVYGGDIGGNESDSIRSISLAKRRVVALAESYRERYADRANWASLVSGLRFDPYRILVYGNKDVGSSSVGYWMLDIRTGERRTLGSQEEKPDGVNAFVDKDGVIKARSYYIGEKVVFEVRDAATKPFVRVKEFPANDPRWLFLSFAADGETLYFLTTEETDTRTVRSINTRTRELSAPIFNSPEGDALSVIQSWDRGKLYGVAYETDKIHFQWFDADRAALQGVIDASLPNTQNYVVSSTRDEKKLVILATGDRDPGTYYLLDLSARRMNFIGKSNRHLKSEQLSAMEPIQFTARDGKLIHGYLTRPLGSAGKRVPLIINPHGGPFGIRDSWGYNEEVQFLANRGYAVLQINYRGSGGYGLAFEEAGKREWGGKMQDDLSDGVAWAIGQGITDANHVGIYGGSYGGYAALAGATFTPDLYRCAVNYVGVSDLTIITSWARGRFGRDSNLFATEWIGDNKDYKRDHSPVNFVDRIKIPLLNAYGFNDPRVDIDHWKRLEAKLKQYNKTYEIIIEKDEGHGFRNEASRMNFYRRLETFLTKYMNDVPAGRVEVKDSKVIEMPVKGTN